MSRLRTWKAVQDDARPCKDWEGIYSQFARGEVQLMSNACLSRRRSLVWVYTHDDGICSISNNCYACSADLPYLPAR